MYPVYKMRGVVTSSIQKTGDTLLSEGVVLVTGLGGLIGGAVAEALTRRGDDVIGLDRVDPPRATCRVMLHELGDANRLHEIMRATPVRAIIHAGGASGPMVWPESPARVDHRQYRRPRRHPRSHPHPRRAAAGMVLLHLRLRPQPRTRHPSTKTRRCALTRSTAQRKRPARRSSKPTRSNMASTAWRCGSRPATARAGRQAASSGNSSRTHRPANRRGCQTRTRRSGNISIATTW